MTQAAETKPTEGKPNPNFVRPGDPQRAMGGKNFISRESAHLRATEIEQSGGVAVRRPDESDDAFKKRSGEFAEARAGERKRAVMSPQVARRELESLEKKWAGRVPTAKEIIRFATEFDYMNDCRVALGWPEVDYTKPRETEKGNAAQTRFIAFKKRPERDRLATCVDSEDLPLMRMAAVHDLSEDVRAAAERRMQDLWAKKSAAQ